MFRSWKGRATVLLRTTRTRILLLVWSLLVFIPFLLVAPPLRVGALRTLEILLLGALTLYTFWFSGYRLRRCLRERFPEVPDPLEASVIEFGLGTGLFMGVLIAAGACGLLREWMAWSVIALALLGPHRTFLSELRLRLQSLCVAGVDRVLIAFLLTAGCLTLILSLTPVTSQDALVYHLAVPARYVEAGGFVPVEGNFFANFPQNMEMLFTLGLLLDAPSLAQLYHWAMGVACVGSVAVLARQIAPGASALLAATVFATIPTVTLIAGWAYIDLGVVFFMTTSLVCFLNWRTSTGLRWLALAAVFAGLAAGTKYTGGFQGLLLVAGALMIRREHLRSFRRGWLPALMAGAVVGVIACPWWIKNVLFTGNPLYPFCYGIFGGKGWDGESASILSSALLQWGDIQSPVDILLVPWKLTMSGEFFSQSGFDGVIGCAFLMALPFLLAGVKLSDAYRIVAVFFLAHATFWVFTTQQVRFLLPALACASALVGAAIPSLAGAPWSRSVTGWILKGAFGLNILITAFYFAHHNPLPVVLGLEKEEAFLRREIPGGDYPVFEYIESELPEDSRIFFASLGNPGFLCKRDYYSDAFIENRTLIRFLEESADEEALLKRFQERGFTHLLFRWPCVFDPTGRKSDVPMEGQMLLMSFLNRHGRLLTQKAGTFLYELGEGLGAASSES